MTLVEKNEKKNAKSKMYQEFKGHRVMSPERLHETSLFGKNNSDDLLV